MSAADKCKDRDSVSVAIHTRIYTRLKFMVPTNICKCRQGKSTYSQSLLPLGSLQLYVCIPPRAPVRQSVIPGPSQYVHTHTEFTLIHIKLRLLRWGKQRAYSKENSFLYPVPHLAQMEPCNASTYVEPTLSDSVPLCLHSASCLWSSQKEWFPLFPWWITYVATQFYKFHILLQTKALVLVHYKYYWMWFEIKRW